MEGAPLAGSPGCQRGYFRPNERTLPTTWAAQHCRESVDTPAGPQRGLTLTYDGLDMNYLLTGLAAPKFCLLEA